MVRNCKQHYPLHGESERIVLLVVIYFTIMLLPLLIPVTNCGFHALADLHRRVTRIEPMPASA